MESDETVVHVEKEGSLASLCMRASTSFPQSSTGVKCKFLRVNRQGPIMIGVPNYEYRYAQHL